MRCVPQQAQFVVDPEAGSSGGHQQPPAVRRPFSRDAVLHPARKKYRNADSLTLNNHQVFSSNFPNKTNMAKTSALRRKKVDVRHIPSLVAHMSSWQDSC